MSIQYQRGAGKFFSYLSIAFLLIFQLSFLAGRAEAAASIGVSSPSNGANFNVSSSSGTSVTVTGITAPWYCIYLSIDGGSYSDHVTMADGSGNWSYNTPVLAPGSHNITAYVTGGSYSYVPAQNKISVVDQAGNLVNEIPIPGASYMYKAVSSPDGSKVYVANYSGNSVIVINTQDDQVIANIPVGNGPAGIAFNSTGSKAYVTNSFSNTMSIIDVATNIVASTLPAPDNATAIARIPGTDKLYILSGVGIGIFDSSTDTWTGGPIAGTENALYGITTNTSGSKAYITNNSLNSVTVVDTSTDSVIGSPISVGSGPYGIVRAGNEIFVGNSTGGSVSVISAISDTLVDTISPLVGANPYGVSTNNDESKVFVSSPSGVNGNQGSTWIIDAVSHSFGETTSVAYGAMQSSGNFNVAPNTISVNLTISDTSSSGNTGGDTGGNPGGNNGSNTGSNLSYYGNNTLGVAINSTGENSDGTGGSDQNGNVLSENTSGDKSGSTKEKDDNGEVKGVSKSDFMNNLNWLWWSLIALAVIALIIWLIARKKRDHKNFS
jgi:YVTN family beta-propeller protein